MNEIPEALIMKLVPYIRLTKTKDNAYVLWVAVFAPANYSVEKTPTVQTVSDSLVKVSVRIEGPKDSPSQKKKVIPLKINLPTPDAELNQNATIKTTVWLDDPEDEGSSVIKYPDAEQE